MIREDEYHSWATAVLGRYVPPILTCEVVPAEACRLFRGVPRGANEVLRPVSTGWLKISFSLGQHSAGLERMIAQYHDVPMSLADTCLVRVSELFPGADVLTLDSDFLVCRTLSRKVVPTVMPPRT